MIVGSTVTFFDRFTRLSSDQLLEGSFWSLWCGSNLKNWTQSVKEHAELEFKPLSVAEKADQVWIATKNLFFKTCSALSGLSMVICWAADVSLIFIGTAFPYISAGGYWASSLVSGSKIWETLEDIGKESIAYSQIDVTQTKEEIAFRQVQNLIKLSFFVCIAAWAVLSGVHALVGGEQLFEAADNLFYYGAVLFCSNIVTLIIQPSQVRKRASSSENGA